MAIVNNFGQDTQDPNQQDPNAKVGQPISVSGSSAAPSNGPSGAPNSTATPTGTSSGRYTNLSNYLNANKGFNAAGGGLAGQINSNISGQVNQFNQDLNNSQNNFNQAASAGSAQYDPSFVSNFINAAGTQPAPSSQTNSTSTPAASNGINVDDLNKFYQMRDATYTGPQSLANQYQLQSQGQNLQSLGNAATTDQGRYSLLNSLYGKGWYTSGAQSLDNLLLQGNPQQAVQMSALKNLTNNAYNQFNNVTGQVGATVANNQNAAANAQTNTRNALGQAITGYDQSITDKLAAAPGLRDSAYKTAQDYLGQGQFSPDLLTQIGSSVTPGQYLYGVDPSKYLTETATPTTKQGVESNADVARIQALSQLAGDKLSGPASSALDFYKDQSQAGSYNPTDYTFDANKFNQAVNTGKQSWQALPTTQQFATPFNYGNGQTTSTSQYIGQLRDQVGSTLTDLQKNPNAPFDPAAAASKLALYGMPLNVVEAGHLTKQQYVDKLNSALGTYNALATSSQNAINNEQGIKAQSTPYASSSDIASGLAGVAPISAPAGSGYVSGTKSSPTNPTFIKGDDPATNNTPVTAPVASNPKNGKNSPILR